MEKRRLGRTGHMSTLAIFGGAALSSVDQETANKALDLMMSYGVNHIDIAYSYGDAEIRVGPWLESRREQFFLGGKTGDRTRDGAWKELHESLERLRTGALDLYQLHAVNSLGELDKIFAPGGAIETFQQARDAGLTKFLGITAHGMQAPATHAAALERFDFDTVLFPLNANLYADPGYRSDAERLLALAAERDVGVIIIKSVAKQPWGDREHKYATWYEPFDVQEKITEGVRFALSQPGVTCIASAGDVNIMPMVMEAGKAFEPMSEDAQPVFIEELGKNQVIFPSPWD